MAFQHTIEALVVVSVLETTKGKYIKAEFLDENGTLLTSYNPKGIRSIDWVKRISAKDGKPYVESLRPIIVTYSHTQTDKDNSIIAVDCKLYPLDFSFQEYRKDTPNCILETKWTKAVKRHRPTGKRDATPNVDFPSHTYPFMLGRKWGDDSKCSEDPSNTRPATELRPLQIDGTKANADKCNHLILAYASVMLDRETDARQFHRILFSQEQWDRLASEVHEGEKVILRECSIQYDLRDEEVIVNTEEHYDFAEGEGFTVGIFDRYIPGDVTRVRSIAIERELSLKEDDGKDRKSDCPARTVLETFDELCAKAYDPSDYYTEDYEDYYDDYEPSLSDSYDDLEELELNTRGDGYD